MTRVLTLEAIPGLFSVCRLPADAAVPDWVDGPGLTSVTRTGSELSIVVRSDRVPSGVTATSGWTGLRVAGTLAFSEIGIIKQIAAVLADATVSVFVVSTYDTDFVFLPVDQFEAARHALLDAGHEVSDQVEISTK